MKALTILNEKLLQIYEASIAQLPLVVSAIIVLVVFYYIRKLILFYLRKYLKKIKIRLSLIEVFNKFVSLGIWLFGILIACAIMFPSFSISSIITAIGLGSVAVGFAFKDIFENFLAGILMLLREPFKLKDFIECNEYDGVVEQITIRDTFLRRSNGERIVLPNAILFKSGVTVVTDLDLRRTKIEIGVSYDVDVEKVLKILEEIVIKVDSVDKDKGVDISATEFADSSIIYKVMWWTKPSPGETRRSKTEVIAAIYKEFSKKGIEIPYPQHDIFIKNYQKS